MRQTMVTYLDMEQHLLAYMGGDTNATARQVVRRAIQEAMRTAATCRRWTYFTSRGRVSTVAAQTDGTVAFDYTGGLYERMMTLTGSTWPDWVIFGTIRIGTTAYEVAEQKSSTIITLSRTSNPGADLAAGTSYTLFRDTYPMPIDFRESDAFVNMVDSFVLEYVHPSQWLKYQLALNTTARPTSHTFRGDPNYIGQMAVSFDPPPDAAYDYDFIYQRQPRALFLAEYKAGFATATISSTSVTGTGSTVWASSMKGSVIRFSATTADYPTGQAGLIPTAMERVIVDVTDAATLVLDEAADQTLAAVKYVISDPVDVDQGAMRTYLFREAERQLRLAKRLEPSDGEDQAYMLAQTQAFESDSRYFGRRTAGDGRVHSGSIRNMPQGADIGG